MTTVKATNKLVMDISENVRMAKGTDRSPSPTYDRPRGQPPYEGIPRPPNDNTTGDGGIKHPPLPTAHDPTFHDLSDATNTATDLKTDD